MAKKAMAKKSKVRSNGAKRSNGKTSSRSNFAVLNEREWSRFVTALESPPSPGEALIKIIAAAAKSEQS